MSGVIGAAGRIAAVLAAALALAAAAERVAQAHAVGVSSGEYRLDGTNLYADLGLADRELARWQPALDKDHDGAISADELAAGHDLVGRALMAGLTVTAGERRCLGTMDRAWVTDGDGGAVLQVRFACPGPPARLTLAAPLLAALAPGHRHVARLFWNGKAHATVVDRAHPTWTVTDAAAAASAASLAWAMLKLGFEHILTGFDHLIFLFGLILVGGRLRSLIGVISAFTLAHSLTLALSTLSVFAPSPRLVEPAIALSIAYVGSENVFVPDARRRWRITFPFGLIHGFGFAGALREIALPRVQVPVALVSFNAGVELGQLAVLLAALPFVMVARRAPWFGERGVRTLSVAIAAGGVALFIVRLAQAR